MKVLMGETRSLTMEEVRKIKDQIVERKEVLEQAWEASCVQECDE